MYKGLRGTLERLIVSDAQVDQQIDRLVGQHPRIVQVEDRPSRAGDELVLDYAGYADGEQFEGGTAERQTLTLGSHTFIPGFEEQLIGRRAGDEVDVQVTFPEQYHASNLAGKPAVFKCRIHEIRLRQRRESDDDFAREVAGLESLEALRQRMRERMQAFADRQAEDELMARLVDQLLEDFDCEVTAEQLDEAVDYQMRNLEGQLQQRGLTLEAYCRFTGRTVEQLRAECRPDAEKGLRRQSVIAEIAEAEGIEADEESVADAIRDMCRQNGMTIEQLAPLLDEAARSAIVHNVVTEKVLALIRQHAVIDTSERRDS